MDLSTDESDVLISAIEHYSYCPRQCALIHVEQTFEENVFTMKGQLAHERVNTGIDHTVRGMRTARDLVIWSTTYGLRGKTDVVEFHPHGPYPVEYKLGHRPTIHAERQLCAQALCLEEMFQTGISAGAIYCVGVHRRHEVVFDARLRSETLAIVAAIRTQLSEQQLPVAPNDRRCRNCSLIHTCIPAVVGAPSRIRGHHGALFQVYGGEDLEDE